MVLVTYNDGLGSSLLSTNAFCIKQTIVFGETYLNLLLFSPDKLHKIKTEVTESCSKMSCLFSFCPSWYAFCIPHYGWKIRIGKNLFVIHFKVDLKIFLTTTWINKEINIQTLIYFFFQNFLKAASFFKQFDSFFYAHESLINSHFEGSILAETVVIYTFLCVFLVNFICIFLVCLINFLMLFYNYLSIFYCLLLILITINWIMLVYKFNW